MRTAMKNSDYYKGFVDGLLRAASIIAPLPGPEGRDWQIDRAIRDCKRRFAEYFRKEAEDIENDTSKQKCR
jgi:hypothetical protein